MVTGCGPDPRHPCGPWLQHGPGTSTEASAAGGPCTQTWTSAAAQVVTMAPSGHADHPDWYGPCGSTALRHQCDPTTGPCTAPRPRRFPGLRWPADRSHQPAPHLLHLLSPQSRNLFRLSASSTSPLCTLSTQRCPTAQHQGSWLGHVTLG